MMPSGWKQAHIKEVGTVVTGSTPPTKDLDNYGDEYMFVSPADMGNHKYVRSSVKMVSKKGFDKGRKIPPKSTLFTCIGSTIGKIGMNEVELITNQQINSVVPNSDVDPDFIYYSLENVAQRIKKLAGQQAVPLINKSDFEEETITLPVSQDEQEKIAKILSTWDEAIEKLEKIEKVLEGRHFYLRKKCFSDHEAVVDLKDAVEIIYGKSPKGFIVEDGKYPIVGTSGVVGRTNSPITSSDTVVLGRKGTLDKPIYVTGPCLPIDTTFWTKPKTGYQLRWIFHLTKYLDLSKYNEASGVPSLGRENLYKVKVPNHSESAQKKTIHILDCSQSEIDKTIAVRKVLQIQKQGLMQQLLTGKKRVKV